MHRLLFFVLCSICLTKMDILDTFDEIKIGVCYKLDGKVLDSMPGQLVGSLKSSCRNTSISVLLLLQPHQFRFDAMMCVLITYYLSSLPPSPILHAHPHSLPPPQTQPHHPHSLPPPHTQPHNPHPSPMHTLTVYHPPHTQPHHPTHPPCTPSQSTTPTHTATQALLEKVEVEYVSMPGWKTSLAHMKSLEELPPNAKAYVSRLSELTGMKGK